MSAERLNSIVVVVSLVPWIAVVVAMALALVLDARDGPRDGRVDELRAEHGERPGESEHRRQPA